MNRLSSVNTDYKNQSNYYLNKNNKPIRLQAYEETYTPNPEKLS